MVGPYEPYEDTNTWWFRLKIWLLRLIGLGDE